MNTTPQQPYAIVCTVQCAFDEAKRRTIAALTDAGFGVLTEIDLQGKLQGSLGVTMDEYVILGACRPESAYKAVQAEQMIGLLLPCNVIIYRKKGETVIAAIDPMVAMRMVDSVAIEGIAQEITERLRTVIASLREEA